jgi:hypothetical protein
VLDPIGGLAVENIKTYISELEHPPNAPSTIEKKGFDNPLIDSEQMKEAVMYKKAKK